MSAPPHAPLRARCSPLICRIVVTKTSEDAVANARRSSPSAPKL